MYIFYRLRDNLLAESATFCTTRDMYLTSPIDGGPVRISERGLVQRSLMMGLPCNETISTNCPWRTLLGWMDGWLGFNGILSTQVAAI